MATERIDQTRDRRQFKIKMSKLDEALVASGDLKTGALKSGDRISAVVTGSGKLSDQFLVIIRDRVTERTVPDSEPET